MILFTLIFTSVDAYSQESLAILPFTFTDDGHLSIQKGKEAQQFFNGLYTEKAKPL